MQKMEMNLHEFKNYIEEKRCICFGAGLQGIRLINIFDNWKKTNDIIAFIDNNSCKWGKQMEYDGISYPILSIDESLSAFQDNVILIITCMDFISIKSQLEQYDELKNVPCFSLVEIGQRELIISDYKEIEYDYDKQMIPKKIHYCWFGDVMPEFLKRNVEEWHRLCPDYEIIEWNESNYDVNKNQYIKQAYEMKKWSYVSDYVRLDLIYEYGGIYLDTDIKIVKRPDELLYQDGFACFDSTLLMNLGAGFGARDHQKIIKELRDYYDDIEFSYSDGTYNKIPCMTHSYNVLKAYKFTINDTLQKVEGINIYPMVFQATCAYTRQMRITEKTFFIHYGTTTWLDQKSNEVKNELEKVYSEKNTNGLCSYNLN